jgi:hypothetical protein
MSDVENEEHWNISTGIAEPEYTFISRQQLGKQVPEEMNTHTQQ